MDLFFETREEMLSSVFTIVLFAVVFLLGKWFKDLTTSYSVNKQLTHEDNPALATSFTGYLVGITIIFLGAVDGPHVGLWEDLIAVGSYSIAGILALNLARVINDKLIMHQFSSKEEIVDKRNVAAGVVQGASYVASGMVIAGAIHGEGGGPFVTIAFFAIGQIILIIFALLYEKIISYNVHEELGKNNLAAGLGFSGGIISIGIIAMKAVSGDFEYWSESLQLLAFDIGVVFIYLFAVRFFFDKLIIPHSDLNKEIAEDKNIGAGVLEMFVAIGFSMVLFYTL